ncbi:MAG TPA: beta-ketoacyl-ACP synthase III [Gemmatimonadaceae bacterium]
MKRPIAKVVGTGRGIPSTVITNFDFAKIGVETSDEWIVERTGIRQRNIAKTETGTELASTAARNALAKAGLGADDLDLIVLATASPDRLLPSAAGDLQAAIGATRATAFDVGAACSGFIFCATVAEGLLAAQSADTALIVGVEKLSAIVDWQDRKTCVLFGDGAGAAVLARATDADHGILASYVRSDGTLGDLLCRPGGGARQPFSSEVLAERSWFIQMNGREVFKHAVRSMADAAAKAIEQAHLTADDIDVLIPHQANIRIIEATAKYANIPMEKVYVNVDRFGNTSAASIPIALDEAIEMGRITAGSTVLLVAFGAGFTWGSLVIRF